MFALPAGLGDAVGVAVALAMLPLALIPTVAVPLAVALQVVSLRRLTPAAHRAGPERMATAG